MNYNSFERMELVGLSSEQTLLIQDAGKLLQPHIEALVETFYSRMQTYSELQEIISKHTTTDRLKTTFTEYIQRLFSGNYGEEYQTNRIQVGLTHNRVGLPLMWYLGMFSQMEHLIYEHLMPYYEAKALKEWKELYLSISSLIRYDQLFAIDAYVDAYTAQLRRETAAAESAKKSKSMFLATVSHELRTPLSSILGYTDLMLDTSNEITPHTRQHLQALHRNAQNLLLMINGLIEIGKVDSGKWQSSPSKGSLKALFDDMAISAEGLLIGKNVRIIKDYNTENDGHVFVDFSRLRQITLNLISNACKFTDEGSISIGYRVFKNHFVIHITDTGIGIPEEEKEKIFVEFYRIQGKGARKPGSGLGLALVKTLVEAMRGSITVNSALQKGSTFTVSIPLLN